MNRTNTMYKNGQLVVTRIYDAPRDAVFNAWIQISKVQKWWGCDDTVQVKSTIEPKLGGKFVHVMTHRLAGDLLAEGVITEYDPPGLLTYEVPGSGADDTMTVRVEFTECETGTKVQLTHSNIEDAVSEFVIVGWTAALRKLGELLVDEANAA